MTTDADAPLHTDDDVARIETRRDFVDALAAARARAGLTVREVVSASGGLHGTIAGWFSGQHLPVKASREMFHAVLTACGITDDAQHRAWDDAAARARRKRPGRPTGPAPYRGLEAFEQEDAEWFFGRDDLVGSLTARIERAVQDPGPGTVVVIGPSGSGKSSLLRAGFGARVGRPDTPLVEWRLEVITPGSDPVAALEAVDPAPRRILVVDQFEEVWTQCEDPTARDRFLRGIAAEPVAVLGLRADFYAAAASEPELVAALDDGPVIVGPMTREQLRSVVVEPATKAGVRVEDELVQLLLDEAAPRRITSSAGLVGSLPLLSHALLGTWARSSGKTLTVADYYATGGIAGAVQQTAEEVFDGLTAAQQSLAQRLFLRLVNVDDDTESRRRARRQELFVGDGQDDTDDITTIIDRFADRRLLTLGEETVEISHEALLSAWTRLRDWIDRDRAGLAVQRQLVQAAQVWEESGRDVGALLMGVRLAVVQDWLAGRPDAPLTIHEREFVDASAEHEQTERHAEQRRITQLRRLVTALACVSVVALLLAVTAFAARSSAEDQRTIAEQARNDAMSRQVATKSVGMRDKDPALAAQLALAAYQVSPTLEARSALLDSTAIHGATRFVGPAGGMKARPGPDGTWVASATSDGVVRLWDTADPTRDAAPIAEIVTNPDGLALFALALSPDGRRLAAGGAGGTSLWDVSTPSAPRKLADLTDAETVVQNMVFSPDGGRLAAGTADTRLLVWDVTGPVPVERPTAAQPGTGKLAVGFSPDGRLLVTAGKQNALRIWDSNRTAPGDVPLYEIPPADSITDILSVAVSPDGRVLAASTTRREVLRWTITDPARPVAMPALTGFDSYVNEVGFSPDGALIAAGSSDNTVRLWRTSDDQPLETLPGPGVVTSVAFANDGRSLLTAGIDGVTRSWPVPGPVLAGAKDSVFVTAVGGDGETVLVGAGALDDGLPLWNIGDPAVPTELPELRALPGDKFTGAVALSSRGGLAAAGTSAGAAYVWDVADPARPVLLAGPLPAVEGIVGAVRFDPDARVLAVAGQDGRIVTLFDVRDRTHPARTATFDAANYPQGLAFSPDGAWLAVPTADNTVELWDVRDPAAPQRKASLGGFESYAQSIAFSPDGRILAAGSADRSVRLWDAASLAAGDAGGVSELAHMTELPGAVYSVSFDPDGRHLAAGLGSGEIWVWNVESAADPSQTSVLSAYGTRVFDAAFAADGDILVGSGPDRLVRLWITDPEEAAAHICGTAGTTITEEEWRRYLPGVPYATLCA